MVCKNTFRWGSFTEQELQVLHEAGEILERLRNEGKVKPHPTNSELVNITTSDEKEHEILSKTVQILKAKP